jgi:hypothetical protein
MPSRRYEVTGPWSIETINHYAGASVTTEIADLRDKRNGQVYRQGAYRVRVRCHPVLSGQPRTKSFYGETAWSDAARYADDALWWFRQHADRVRSAACRPGAPRLTE